MGTGVISEEWRLSVVLCCVISGLYFLVREIHYKLNEILLNKYMRKGENLL